MAKKAKSTKSRKTKPKTDKSSKFIDVIEQGYKFSGDVIVLGTAIYEEKPLSKTLVKAPLATLNRHGLIAGATGTGKTRTLQLLAEGLSSHGCPVLLMDIKGDLSGISQPGSSNPKILERSQKTGVIWEPKQFPIEFLSISKEPGVRLRATVSEFGPVLFSRILEINDTQGGAVSLVFKYCDDNKLGLLDLKDFKKVLQFLTNEGKKQIKQDYGSISTTSASTIMRKVLELEQQGADVFFGEKSFDVEDLLRKDSGKGYINILRLTDIQNTPKLFSSFMLCLLAEVFQKFPEEGDVDKPKLVIFIDEAHLIFENASKTLLNEIKSVIKLIRSKGVGVFFCTQSPSDIPNDILGQLGMKIQHSLRAFTAKDRKDIKLASENFPSSNFYDIDERMTSMGIGEALITVLNDKGVPSPLADTLMCAPESSMETISENVIDKIVSKSSLVDKYEENIDRDSAYEILNKKLDKAATATPAADKKTASGSGKRQKSVIEEIARSPMAKQVGRTVAREITRGLLGALGVKTKR